MSTMGSLLIRSATMNGSGWHGHRGAYFVSKALSGVKPAELPFERSDDIKLILNLKTANALGVTVPASLLMRAHEVVR